MFVSQPSLGNAWQQDGRLWFQEKHSFKSSCGFMTTSIISTACSKDSFGEGHTGERSVLSAKTWLNNGDGTESRETSRRLSLTWTWSCLSSARDAGKQCRTPVDVSEGIWFSMAHCAFEKGVRIIQVFLEFTTKTV